MFPYPAWTFEVDWNDDGTYEAFNEGVNLVGLRVRRGRDFFIKPDGKGFERFAVGTATLTLTNLDRRYDPRNAASPLYPNVKPGHYARLQVHDGTTLRNVLTGRISDIRPTGDVLNPRVQMTIEDGWIWLKERATSVAVQENIGTATAIGLVLDDVGWPTIWGRDLMGSADTIRYWWADQRQADAEILDLAESELGLFTIAADGKARFRGRHSTDDVLLTISQGDVQRDVGLPQPWEVVRGEVRVIVHPRVRQATGELWRLQDQPFIPAGEKLTVFAPYAFNNENVPAIGIQQPEPTLDYSLAGMGVQYADGEEGTTADFDSVVTTGGATFAASAAAALRGSYGFAVTPAGAGTTAYGRLTGPSDERITAVGLRFDPNSLTMPNGTIIHLAIAMMDAPIGGTAAVARIQLDCLDGQFRVRAHFWTDAAAGAEVPGSLTSIDDAPHRLLLVVKAASAAGANDGEVHFYVDGVLRGKQTGIDNDQRLVDWTGFGAVSVVGEGISGSFYTDDCWWSDVAVEATPFGLTAKVEVSNGASAGGNLTLLRLMGDALAAPNPTILEATAAANVRSVFEHDLPWQQDTNVGMDMAKFLASLLSGDQLYPTVSIVGRPDLQFAVDLLDRIHLNLPDHGIDDDYRVGMIEHEWLDAAGMVVRTTLRSENAITLDGYWMFTTEIGLTSVFGV